MNYDHVIEYLLNHGGVTIKSGSTMTDHEWELFYDNFNPDDWDYMIWGENEHLVAFVAQQLEVCYTSSKQIGALYYAVTYHS